MPLTPRDFAAVGKQGAQWGFLPNLNAAATHGYNWGQTIDRYTNTFATDRVRTNNFYLGSDWMLFGGLSQQNQFKQAKLDNLSAEEGAWQQRDDVRRYRRASWKCSAVKSASVPQP
ncbi:MAG: hypothetical protein IPO56_08130 [Flavobacteriales bacterium]|nr:hypothetical protein [Flavobacteriales bacterium]